MAVWQDEVFGDSYRLESSVYDEATNEWSASVDVAHTISKLPMDAQVIVRSDGALVAVWQDEVFGDSYRLESAVLTGSAP